MIGLPSDQGFRSQEHGLNEIKWLPYWVYILLVLKKETHTIHQKLFHGSKEISIHF